MNRVEAQCNPPDQLPTPTCDFAPLICLQGACYETLGIPNSGPTGWCNGSNTIENPQFFSFIPTAPNVEIHVHVDNCDSGTSLQAAIISECPWGVEDVLACNGGTAPGGTIVLVANGLVVGQPYLLMFDGNSGALCNYTVTYTNNIYSPGFEEELSSAEAVPYSVCLGADALMLVAEPAIAFAHGYFWVLEWNGDTVFSTLPTTTVPVPSDIDPGLYEICVWAYSGCDTTENELCFEVEVYETADGERPPTIVCPEEFPLQWGNLVINDPGEYERSFDTPEGCAFDSVWVIETYPTITGIIDTVHCLPIGENTFYYEGEAYDASGTYEILYPKADINGCDSIAELNLFSIGIDAFTELTCNEGEFVITAYVQEVIPFNADVEFYWYEQGGSQVAEGNPFMTLEPECYELYIHVITSEGTCEFYVETICIDGDTYYPPPPVLGNNTTLVCGTEGIFFCIEEDPFGEPNLEYVWSAPSNVPVYQDGSECVEMDFSNSQGGQVCVYAIGECGSGSSTCFEVQIIQSPVATIDFAPEICVNELTSITFTGTASPTAQFIWDFNTPSSVTGTGLGPYQLSWAGAGNKTISLSIIEPGCDTAYKSVNINVDYLPSPVINCISTINSIDFDWDDIPGASGYLVSLNGVAAVPIMASDTMLTMLTPGTSVELILTTLSSGPCPDLIDTLSCTAQNCPPPLIELSGQDSACLNNPTIIDLEAIVNGNPGTGTWIGAGITDVNSGLFDPKIAGPGQHQLTYAVDENGCSFNQPYTITVFDSITADFTLDPAICISDIANLQYNGNASANATFNFDLASATIQAGSGIGPYQLSYNNAGQQMVRLQVEENGCVSDIISHNTDVVANLVAPVVPCTPNTSGVIFSWTLDPAATGHVIDVLSGHVGTNNGTTYNFSGLTQGEIVIIEIISQTNGPCPERRDTFECEARACPPVLLSIAPVDDICLYPGIGNVDLDVTITNGNGAGDWMGNGVIDNLDGTFDPTVAGIGTHLITYHYLDDGCDFFETITINVNDVPDAFITNNDLIITCASNSIFLDGSSSSGTALAYLWTTSDGSIASGADAGIAEVVKPGVYQLLVTTPGGCSDSVSVTVTQDSNIPVADAGPDKTLTCDSTQFTLGGLSDTGANVIYLWSTADGNIISEVDKPAAVADHTGEYIIVVRDTVTGCQSQDNAIISIDTSVANILLVPGDTIDCNTILTSAISTLDEPVEDYTFNWTTSDGLFASVTNESAVTVSQGGNYTLTIHNKRNGCETSSDVLITESDEIIDGLVVDQHNVTCHGDDDGSLSIVNVIGGIPNYSYSWTTHDNSSSITSLAPGTYSVTVMDVNGCIFEQEFSITEPDLVTIDIGEDRTVTERDVVRIDLLTNLNPGSIETIDWSEYNGITCPGCTAFEIVAVSSATISAMIMDTAGCAASDTMRLSVIIPRLLYVPTIFSPNNDGVNDYFTISGRQNLLNIASLRIFDRWGNEIFEKTDLPPGIPQSGWDGTFNGEKIQPGVYVFTAELEYADLSEVIWGNITLIR